MKQGGSRAIGASCYRFPRCLKTIGDMSQGVAFANRSCEATPIAPPQSTNDPTSSNDSELTLRRGNCTCDSSNYIFVNQS
uniref:Uncharacterized protein n=1 Tax=Ascaris lumbricoides TaxID=6252 RepID=A0A0M3HKH5_ASCLU